MTSIASSPSIKSGTSSAQSRRPPSLPSMYQCDFIQPKAPRPLPKIEKKVKPMKTPKVKAEPVKKAKEEKTESTSRGFSIWGVKGRRKVVQAPPPIPKKTISAPIPSPLAPFPSSSRHIQPSSTPASPSSDIVFTTPPPFATSEPGHTVPVVPWSNSPASLSTKTLPTPPVTVPTCPTTPLPSFTSSSNSSGASSQISSSQPSSASLDSSPPPSLVRIPPSPDFHVLCEDDIRFKRIEKLTRTLGEQPPLDLVFPSFKRTYAANNHFPPPPDEPLFVGPQMANARLAKPKEKDNSLSLANQLIRRNSASVLSLPGPGTVKSIKKGRRPATASPTSASPFNSLSPINTSLVSRPITASLFTPTSSPVSTTSSPRRPSTASGTPYDYPRDFYPPPSPSRALSRNRIPFASHESLSSATTASSSSCYSVDTLNSAQLECLPPAGVVDAQSCEDSHSRHGYSPIILCHPPSPITAKPAPVKIISSATAILEHIEPEPTPDDELAAYEEGFAQFKSSPLSSPTVEETPKLRTFTRTPVVASPPRLVRRKPPPTTTDYHYSRARPSTAPASPAPGFKPADRRPTTPFVDTLVPVEQPADQLQVFDKVARPSSRRERRQGWSGEWNRDDMQDVIKKLRTLK